MGTGRFQCLKLTHLIPPHRLTEDYLRKLLAGMAASNEILDSLRPHQRKQSRTTDALRFAWQMLRASDLGRKILLDSLRERKKAREFLSGKRTVLQL